MFQYPVVTVSSCSSASHPRPSSLVLILCRFGGTHDQKCYNDTWVFDVSTRKWTELHCTGSIPSARCSHAAALVDDVMYVFGGRDANKHFLSDLTAFKLSSK
jgi:Galactose oxidase, central domain